MKKHYKIKEVNKTKLKSYLKDADTTNNKRSRTGSCRKCKCSKRNDLH